MMRQIPKHLDKFIQISNSALCDKLQEEGFIPEYFYSGIFYFKKNYDIEKVVSKIERER